MKLLYGLLFFLTLATLGWLSVFGKFCESSWWDITHIEGTQVQLKVLAEYIRQYAKKTGRYPSNNEGLGKVDTFSSRFRSRISRKYRVNQFLRVVYGFGHWEDNYLRLKYNIEDFYSENKRYPSKDRDLWRVVSFYDFDPYEDGSGSQTEISVDIAVAKEGHIFLITKAGILDPWGVPYMYENRNDGIFADFDTPVDKGFKEGFMITIDDGIYVYSIGAWSHYQDHIHDRNIRYTVRTLTVILLTLFLILYIYAARKGEKDTVWSSLKLLLLNGIYFVTVFVWWPSLIKSTCYVIIYFSQYRNDKNRAIYSELIQKYRSSGVITEETYRKFEQINRDLADEE